MKLTQPDHLKRGDFGGNSSQGNSTIGLISDLVGTVGPAIGGWLGNQSVGGPGSDLSSVTDGFGAGAL